VPRGGARRYDAATVVPSDAPADPLPLLRLLGGVELFARGQRIHRFGGRVCTLLLARLALQPRAAVPREVLIDGLWPDADLDTGRNRLRNALAVLRAALRPAGCEHMIEATRDALRLSASGCAVDVHLFREAVARHQWLEARNLYRGELMPGHYEDWVEAERATLDTLRERIPADLPGLPTRHQQALEAVQRALLLARRGAPDFQERALAQLRQIRREAPDFGLVHLRLSTTLHSIALRRVGPQRRDLLAEARAMSDRAAELDPDDPFTRAVALVHRYRHDLPFNACRDALRGLAERWPESRGPWAGLSMIHNDVGRADEAEAYARLALRQAPLEVTDLYNIGVARMNGYRFHQAVAMFDEVLELEPGHAVSMVGRFFALAGAGRFQDAQQQVQAALAGRAIEPDQAEFYGALLAHWRGDAVEAQRRHARPDVQALCAREPAYEAVRLVHLGRPHDATAVVRRLHDDADPNMLIVLGSRNGLDTRRVPGIEAVARALSWRPLDEMLRDAAAAESGRSAA
jgi:tetratricopeptide (TPR) repeat protein